MSLERLATIDLPLSGPNQIEQLAGIARGAYSEIIDIIAPSSAPAGSTVWVSIWIKNIWTASVHVAAVGIWDTEKRFVDWLDLWIPAGETYSFSGSFTMPNRDVTLHAYSYYEDVDGYWRFDDEAERNVKLAVVWQKLATKTITLTPEVVAVWQKLATQTVTLTPEVVEAVWQKLATQTVTLTPEVVEAIWEKLATQTVTITPEVVEAIWEKLATQTVTITPEVIEAVWEKLAERQVTITPEVEIPPEYQLIQETIYPWAYTFEGDAETCIFEFKLTPEQIPGTEWLGQRIVDSFVSELEKEGSRLLELKVYEDTTPTWWTNYRVEVTATASPLAWNLIIIGVLAVLFVVAIVFALKAVESLIYHRKGLDEETKKTFSRETLTAMILDLEPETPPETLEGMSDQELRDLLNQLLAEAAPPISPWGILAIAGGLGVLGVGAAVALSMAKPAE